MTELGPYPVSCLDPDYVAAVGHHGFGFWLVVQDSTGAEVFAAGGADDLLHIKDLLEASWTLIDWPSEAGILDALRVCDPALHSEHPGINRLIGASR